MTDPRYCDERGEPLPRLEQPLRHPLVQERQVGDLIEVLAPTGTAGSSQ